MPSAVRIKPAILDPAVQPGSSVAPRAVDAQAKPARLKTVSGSLLVQRAIIGSGVDVVLVNRRARHLLTPGNDEVAALLQKVIGRKSAVVQYGTARGEVVAGRGGARFRVVELTLGLSAAKRR